MILTETDSKRVTEWAQEGFWVLVEVGRWGHLWGGKTAEDTDVGTEIRPKVHTSRLGLQIQLLADL